MAMEQNEPLVLKVMRLRRPQVEAPRAMLPHCGAGAPDVPKLLLPMSLTQSLVGEPFTGYLHLANNSNTAVSNVVLKVELQIGPTSKYVLFNNASNPIASIAPDDFFDTDVEHELRTAGTYVLTCNVSYTMPGLLNEPGVFKRSYRFPALQPFAVVHRVAQIDRQLLVECAVENATNGSIYLALPRFDCVDGFEACLVDGGSSASTGGGASDPASGTMHLLKPRGSHSLIYKVTPKSDAIDVAYVRQLDLVGTLALGWHVPDGPSGCAEGHQVRLKPCNTATLDLRVVSCPGQVRVEVPFELELEVVNRGARPAEPSVAFDLRLMGSVRLHGATQHPVGRLEPYSTARVPFNLLVAVPGMHGLQGVSLVDDLTLAKSEFGVLCDILAF